MDRKSFLKTLSLLPLSASAMKLNELSTMASNFATTEKMPVMFVGHGSPMNAIEDNEFSKGWKAAGAAITKPNAVLCISAHWETKGTWVTAMQKPQTIHDFGGFPQALFDVQYPAMGNPLLAGEIKTSIKQTEVGLDDKWGLDHGCWSILNQMFPEANIPVLQLSLDYTKPAQYHYDLAAELMWLRSKGVLIMGSGNLVHNLGMVAWDKLNVSGFGYEWAMEANEKMKKYILGGEHKLLIDYKSQGKAWDMAIPTPEHYLPLLYVLALKKEKETVSLFNDKAVAGSLTMTSVKIG